MTVAKQHERRRKTPWVLGGLTIALLALLIVLQSTNLWKDFSIESSSDLLLLYALSSLNFIAFVIFAFIFLRSIVKLVRERRTFQLGAKIRTRLLIYFVAVSVLPIIAMAVFSYLFLNRALERWFSQIPDNVVREAKALQRQSILDRLQMLDESARMMATMVGDRTLSTAELSRIAEAGGLSYIAVIDANGSEIAAFTREVPPGRRAELERILQIRRENSSSPDLRDGRGYDVGEAEMGGGRRLVIIPDPLVEQNVSQLVNNSQTEFDRLRDKQVVVRQVGLLTLGVLTFLLIFASSWIAFYVARGLTAPIKALAQGAQEIGRGNLGYRVNVLAEDELAILVAAFNEMSSTLESTATELSQRQRYISTVLETLPNGVISFDEKDNVTTVNNAAIEILHLDAEAVPTAALDTIFSSEDRLVIQTLLSRARRVGHASDQLALSGREQGSHGTPNSTVALTAAKLPYDGGVVLVMEDLSELISAQRASAWQEVARRMAHEIKNPLTPIQLSAERIARRFERVGHKENGIGKRITDSGPIGEVVHESTATILREVTSLKSMVDEFSRFARLPDTELRSGDLNVVVAQAVDAFADRTAGAKISLDLSDDVPELSLDAEQMKRVIVNLIENSMEAFVRGSDEPTIRISTRFDTTRGLVVVEVADNGRGIEPANLSKLFQPYFSTKGRGTGLGLSIVSRIIADHHGEIKAVANYPVGAKFIIELPASI